MGLAAAEAHQFHVLAVDDSIIDRKLIERLLKTSSYQGKMYNLINKHDDFKIWMRLFAPFHACHAYRYINMITY